MRSSDGAGVAARGKRSVAAAIGFAVAVTGLLVSAQSSSAVAPGVANYQIVTGATRDLPPGLSSESWTAKCPAGQTAVGGGVRTDNPLILLQQSEPLFDLSGWIGGVAFRNTTSTTFHFTTYAVCVDTSSVPGVHLVSSAQQNVPQGGQNSVDATCTAGEVVLGGGFTTSISLYGLIDESYPATSGSWRAGEDNQSPFTTPGFVQSFAVCVPSGDVADYHQADNLGDPGTVLDQPVPGANNVKTGTSTSPACPDGDLAVGGGTLNSDLVDDLINSVFPSPGSRSWTVTSTAVNPHNQVFAAAYTVCVTGSLAQAPTTTTLHIAPTSPVFNQPVTLTATVSPSTATGTVTFTDNSVVIGTAPLAGGAASLTTTFSGGTHSLHAAYAGDSKDLPSTSAPVVFTIPCAATITGTHAALTVGHGLTCVSAAQISGGITVGPGGSLDLEGATVNGSITASDAAGLRICGSAVASLTVSHATGFVRIGDPADGCPANTIAGALSAAENSGGGVVVGNTISGSWLVTSNQPTWTVSGNHH